MGRAQRRRDVQIDCRGGCTIVTAELLGRVRVTFKGALIRQYDLEYEDGAFGKTRLKSITQRGANGAVFPGTTHTFDYYDDVRNSNGAYAQGFAGASDWTVPSDNVTLCTDLGHTI